MIKNQDIFSMPYVFFIWKILGVAPYTIKGNVGDRTIDLTYKDIALFTIQCVMYLILNIVGIYVDLKEKFESDIITLLLTCTEIVPDILLVIICLLVNLIYYKQICHIIFKIEEEHQRLKQLGVDRKRRNTQTVILLLYTPRLILFLTIWILDNSEGLELRMVQILNLLTRCLVAAVESIMFGLLYAARTIIALSNAKIETFCCEIHKTSSSNSIYGKVLKDCLQIHDNVCNICVNVNEVFNIYLLFKFIVGFSDLVYSTMYLVTYNEHDYYISIDPGMFVWISISVCEIIYLIVICEMTVFETRKLSTILIQVGYNFPEIRTQINLHFLKTYHRKLKFRVCDFFPLDGTFVYSMFTGILTYFIIIMQFKITVLYT